MKPDVDVGVEGSIEAADVDAGIEIVVELENLGSLSYSGFEGSVWVSGPVAPNMHHCATVLPYTLALYRSGRV